MKKKKKKKSKVIKNLLAKKINKIMKQVYLMI